MRSVVIEQRVGARAYVAEVDSMRPGVGDGSLEAVGEALVQLDDQAVVPALAAVFDLPDAVIPAIDSVGREVGLAS